MGKEEAKHAIPERYFSPEDAVPKRGINLAADPLRMALSREEGDPLERFLIERIACYQKFLDRTQKRSQKSESATREALSINRAS